MLVKQDDENLTKIVGVNNGESVGRIMTPIISKQGIHCPLNPPGSYSSHIPTLFT